MSILSIATRISQNYWSSLLFFLGFFPVVLYAQESSGDNKANQLSVLGELRPRLEMREGYLNPLPANANPAIGVNNRVRLGFLFTHRTRLGFGLTMQNVNMWGQSPQVTVQDPTGGLSIFEAWGRLRLGAVEMIVGRQAFNLDNQRLFSTLDWMPGGRAHDGISLKYQDNRGFFKLHGFVAYNQNYKNQVRQGVAFPSYNVLTTREHYYNNNGAQPYQNMQLLWLNFAWSKQKLSLLFNNLGLQNAIYNNGTWSKLAMYFMQTMGFYYTLQDNHWLLDLEGYAQTGRNISGARTRAFLVAGFVGYKHKSSTILLGTDYLSGNPDSRYQNHQGASRINYAFDPLYGLHHKYYGNMDNYYIAQNPTQFGAGIWDKYISFAQKLPGADVTLSLAAHWFHSASLVVNNQNISLGRDLGQELDFSFRYNPHEYVRLEGGYSFYLTTEAQHIVKNVLNAQRFQQWAWLSISFTPTLFKTGF